ncbi:MAG: ABC transporter ATP-binding protein [Acidimicrobiia bacterium]|nr:ABC transporter ATP-binding protein [Acidimicrobiia bacterium]
MDAVLELRGVSKQFHGHRAVDDVSLAVPRGSLFALVGPSGCGKTTVLRMIAGFEIPTTGQVLLSGADVAGLPPYQRNVSTVFQNYALFPHLTARQNIEFGLRRRKASDLDRRVRDVLDLVQLAGKEHRKPAQLSGGEKQRVALARSLVLEPDLLLLDEPLAALDPKLRRQVRVELKSIQRRVGVTFLMVTHDQEEAMSMADSIAVMNKGRLEQIGPPREIYSRPATRFVAGFLGEVSWLNGFGLRPESIILSADGRPATVRSAVYLGNCLRLELQLESGETLLAETNPGARHTAGDQVNVTWRPEDELHVD